MAVSALLKFGCLGQALHFLGKNQKQHKMAHSSIPIYTMFRGSPMEFALREVRTQSQPVLNRRPFQIHISLPKSLYIYCTIIMRRRSRKHEAATCAVNSGCLYDGWMKTRYCNIKDCLKPRPPVAWCSWHLPPEATGGLVAT